MAAARIAIMSAMAATIKDSDVEALADYFSKMRPSLGTLQPADHDPHRRPLIARGARARASSGTARPSRATHLVGDVADVVALVPGRHIPRLTPARADAGDDLAGLLHLCRGVLQALEDQHRLADLARLLSGESGSARAQFRIVLIAEFGAPAGLRRPSHPPGTTAGSHSH